MTAPFPVGARVRLSQWWGPGYEDGGPKADDVVVITEVDGERSFFRDSQDVRWYVHDDLSSTLIWSGVQILDTPDPVSDYSKGFLDGLLRLAVTGTSDDYLRGHASGGETAAKVAYLGGV